MAKAVQISNETLIPVVFVFAFLGSYALRNSLFDMLITVIFGILGYYMNKYNYSSRCMVLAMILGPLSGESFFQDDLTGAQGKRRIRSRRRRKQRRLDMPA